MEYQALNAMKNEIRVLQLPPRLHNRNAAPAELATLKLPPLTMRNVSLDDFNQDFQAYAAETSTGVLSAESYFQWVDICRDKAGLVSLEDAFHAGDLDDNPGPGRWEWGDFSAISYTWGETSNRQDIVINGCPFSVGENLYKILRSFWLDPQSTSHNIWSNIWVDAICINQNDIVERNIQVTRMGDIYKQALAVVGFIGTAGVNLNKAIDFIQHLAELQEHEKSLQGIVDTFQIFTVDQGTLEGLRTFFNLPYWNRLWIVQEIAMSFQQLTFSGTYYALSPVDLLCAILFLKDHEDFHISLAESCHDQGAGPMELHNFLAKADRIRDLLSVKPTSRGSGSVGGLIKLGCISRKSQQKDNRDKIYGMLSLMDPDLADLITPDYSSSVRQVYTNFTKSVITHIKSLDAICSNRACLEDKADIPSWVLDWREPLRMHIMIEMESSYQSSGERAIDVRFDTQNDFMIVKGFTFDIVDGLSVGFDDTKTLVNSNRKVTPTTGSSNAYVNEAMVRNALWHTMAAEPGESEELSSELERVLCISWHFPSSQFAGLSAGDKECLEMFHHLRLMNSNLTIGGTPLRNYYTPRTDFRQDISSVVSSPIFHRVISMAFGRKLIVTGRGWLALASSQAEHGDVICILFGCSVPVILRRSKKCWKLVGECYLHGIMRGEAMKQFEHGKYRQEEFVIG